jgi:predicted MFS family arabinose efflux permease
LVFGPGIIGLIAEAFGVGAPFVFLGAAMAALLVVLASIDYRPVPAHSAPASFSRVLAAGVRRPKLRSALTALSASAIASGTMVLILPLELHALGISTGGIGLVLFLTGLGYVAASTLVTRLGARIVTIRALVITSATLGVFLLPASLGRSAAALVLAATLITPLRGALATLCYELGPRAAGDGVGAASIIGFMGSLWGAVTVVVPLAAGAIYDAAGGQTTFLCAQVAVLAAAALTALGMGQAEPVHAPG